MKDMWFEVKLNRFNRNGPLAHIYSASKLIGRALNKGNGFVIKSTIDRLNGRDLTEFVHIGSDPFMRTGFRA